jgi:hypothetical protein
VKFGMAKYVIAQKYFLEVKSFLHFDDANMSLPYIRLIKRLRKMYSSRKSFQINKEVVVVVVVVVVVAAAVVAAAAAVVVVVVVVVVVDVWDFKSTQ